MAMTLRAASLIVLTMLEAIGPQNVMRIEIRPYLRIYWRDGTNESTDKMEVIFGGKEVSLVSMNLNHYYFVEYFIITTDDKSSVNVTIWRLSNQSTTCIEVTPMRYQCQHICSAIQVSDVKGRIVTFEVYGHDTRYHKYVGCFEAGYFLGNDRFSDLLSCDSTCNDSFYAYSQDEECLCIVSLYEISHVELDLCNILCPSRRFLFCGGDSYLSIYSRREINSIDNEKCQSGRIGTTCEEIDCSKNNGNCGSKKCHALQLGLPMNLGICTCSYGYYVDEHLTCQDVDECLTDEICMLFKGNCFNTKGSYSCKCGRGFYNVDEITCQDVDECSGTSVCDQSTTTCKNLVGDYECLCREGLVRMDNESVKTSCEALTGVAEKTGCNSLVLVILYLISKIVCSLFIIMFDTVP